MTRHTTLFALLVLTILLVSTGAMAARQLAQPIIQKDPKSATPTIEAPRTPTPKEERAPTRTVALTVFRATPVTVGKMRMFKHINGADVALTYYVMDTQDRSFSDILKDAEEFRSNGRVTLLEMIRFFEYRSTTSFSYEKTTELQRLSKKRNARPVAGTALFDIPADKDVVLVIMARANLAAPGEPEKIGFNATIIPAASSSKNIRTFMEVTVPQNHAPTPQATPAPKIGI